MLNVIRSTFEALSRVVDEELARCEAIARSQFSADFPRPVLDWSLKGTSAGQAWGFEKIRLNQALAANYPDQLKKTLAHEYAHCVVDFLMSRTPSASAKGEWSAHGAKWAAVMKAFGYDAERTHSMEVISSRRGTRYEYNCVCGTCTLSSVWHKRALKAAKMGKNLLCRKCKHPIQPVPGANGNGVAIVPIRHLCISKVGFSGMAVYERIADIWRCSQVSSGELSFLKTMPADMARQVLVNRGYSFVWK